MAVKSDMTRLNINDSDYIVFYAPKSAIRKFKPIGFAYSEHLLHC